MIIQQVPNTDLEIKIVKLHRFVPLLKLYGEIQTTIRFYILLRNSIPCAIDQKVIDKRRL